MKMTDTVPISKSKTLMILMVIAAILTIGNGIKEKEVYSESSGSTSKAPDFNLNSIDGKQVSLQSFKGKPVLLWFMSLSCPSCYAQADIVKQVKNEYGNKIDVLVIDIMGDSNKDLQNFISKFGSPDWKTTVDTDRVSIKYGITVSDSTVILDENQNIVFKNLGPAGYQQLKDVLSKVLADTTAPPAV